VSFEYQPTLGVQPCHKACTYSRDVDQTDKRARHACRDADRHDPKAASTALMQAAQEMRLTSIAAGRDGAVTASCHRSLHHRHDRSASAKNAYQKATLLGVLWSYRLYC
jgi:hypothetical protein